MVDFSNLGQYAVEDSALADYTVSGVVLREGAEPVILVGRHAGETNKPYFNALLKTAAQNAERLVAGTVDTEVLRRNREQDRKLYPAYVITSWAYVYDAGGNEVPFTEEACVDLFSKLPDHIIDKARNFFASATNFTHAAGAVTMKEAVAKGKT